MSAAVRSIPFIRVQSCGNDFLLIDNREADLGPRVTELARAVCRRGHSEGADGLLLTEAGEGASSIRMRLINADGSEGEMCGNGALAFARTAVERFGLPADFKLQTLGGDLDASVEGARARVRLRGVSAETKTRVIEADGVQIEARYLEVYGVPHAVVQVHDRAQGSEYARRLGPVLSTHPAFARGANVNFAFVAGSGQLEVRTFERGVNAETLSCGTGSIASFLTLRAGSALGDSAFVRTPGGELHLTAYGAPASPDVEIAGRPRIIAEGRLLDDAWAT